MTNVIELRPDPSSCGSRSQERIDTYVRPFVVSNVDELEKQVEAGTLPLYLDENGIAQCACLPLAWEIDQKGFFDNLFGNRQKRLTPNWIMGDELSFGMDLKKGTVVATFNRSTGQYAQTGAGQGGENHAAIFLGWANRDGVQGMRVVEQMSDRQGRARIGFIPFKADNRYFQNAYRFNVVKVAMR